MKKNYGLIALKLGTFIKTAKPLGLLWVVFIFLGVNTTTEAKSVFHESYAILNSSGEGNTFYNLKTTSGNIDFRGANLGTCKFENSLILKEAVNNFYKYNDAFGFFKQQFDR